MMSRKQAARTADKLLAACIAQVQKVADANPGRDLLCDIDAAATLAATKECRANKLVPTREETKDEAKVIDALTASLVAHFNVTI